MRWTPAGGAAELRSNYPEVAHLLCEILAGRISSRDLATDPTMIPVLQGIGGNHALNLLKDPRGKRLRYWPRVWAARALATIGDPACANSLACGASDTEWRVRMQSVRAAGLVADSSTVEKIASSRVSDPHPRVRAAVALSIGRKGTARSTIWLRDLAQDPELLVRRTAERAITTLQARLR